MLPGRGEVIGPLEVMKVAGSFSPVNLATCGAGAGGGIVSSRRGVDTHEKRSFHGGWWSLDIFQVTPLGERKQKRKRQGTRASGSQLHVVLCTQQTNRQTDRQTIDRQTDGLTDDR